MYIEGFVEYMPVVASAWKNCQRNVTIDDKGEKKYFKKAFIEQFFVLNTCLFRSFPTDET